MRLVITESFAQSSRLAADWIAALVREKPDALLGCATGSSMEGIYREVSEDCRLGRADFSALRAFNLDEYAGLSREHPQSLAFFLDAHLLRKLQARERAFLWQGGCADPAGELARYNAYLADHPADLLLLGIGSNGHIGFNEPGPRFPAAAHLSELSEETVSANARFFQSRDEVPRRAFTIGAAAVVQARRAVLIATGASKAQAVGRLIACEDADPQLPCSILRLCANADVVIDRALYEAALEAGKTAGK